MILITILIAINVEYIIIYNQINTIIKYMIIVFIKYVSNFKNKILVIIYSYLLYRTLNKRLTVSRVLNTRIYFNLHAL